MTTGLPGPPGWGQPAGTGSAAAGENGASAPRSSTIIETRGMVTSRRSADHSRRLRGSRSRPGAYANSPQRSGHEVTDLSAQPDIADEVGAVDERRPLDPLVGARRVDVVRKRRFPVMLQGKPQRSDTGRHR